MLVLLIILTCTLYLDQIALFIFPEKISWIFHGLALLSPIVNTIFALINKKNMESNEEILERRIRNILIIKLVLIPFFLLNFMMWCLVTIVGIVPVFMFMLAAAPIGILYTYWIFLSTTSYSIIVIREYYRFGGMSRLMYFALLISQFIFICDVVGFIVLHMFIKNKKAVQMQL